MAILDNHSEILHQFNSIVSRHGDSLAISSGENSLTYLELSEWAEQVACELIPKIQSRELPVALLVSHDRIGIVGLMAVLMTGCPYTFLASTSAQTNRKQILRDLGATILLTDVVHFSEATHLINDQLAVINIETLTTTQEKFACSYDGSEDGIASINFTSGSTGLPQGVIKSQRGITSRLRIDREIFLIGPGSHLALLRSLNSAASVSTIFNALLNGGSLHMADPRQMSTAQLVDWLIEKKISFFRPPTALLRQILDFLPDGFIFESMRYCRPAGRLLRIDLERLWRYLPESCVVGHGFALTEASLVTHLSMSNGELPDGDVIPVGNPVDGVFIQLFGEDGCPVQGGQVGEIVVSSSTLTPGYWKNPELTAKRIKQDPDNPNLRTMFTSDLGRWRTDEMLEYVGRKDNQIKIRGFRIELDAVEAALELLPGVGQAAARAVEDGRGDYQLIGYVEPVKGMKLSTAYLRQMLAERVPDYMVPSRLIEIDHMPMGATGKIDKKALPAPTRSRPELDVSYRPPSTPTEEWLVRLWSDLLGIDSIGVNDSFFDLGGQSLLAAQIASAITKAYQVDLPLKIIFEENRPATLAKHIDERIVASREPDKVDLEKKLRLLGF